MFAAVCELGLEGIISKRRTGLSLRPIEGSIKVKNPKASAATLILDGTF